MGRDTENKKSFFRRNRDVIVVCVILPLLMLPLFYAYILTQPISPFLPRNQPYAPFERHVAFSSHFPFVVSYFLMVPENYQPRKHTYPLVMMLHGISRHMYGGKVLARSVMRSNFPFFVIIPIAPAGFVWAVPPGLARQPEALPLAMDVLHSVERQYSINDRQIYLTGYSMGGVGTWAALSRYHNVFAAAAPTDSWWDPAQAAGMDAIPVADVRLLAQNLKQNGHEVYYTEYPYQGHGAWVPAYENVDFWMWLIRQQKRPS